MIPKDRVDMSKNNFVYHACMIKNNFEKIVILNIIPDGGLLLAKSPVALHFSRIS